MAYVTSDQSKTAISSEEQSYLQLFLNSGDRSGFYYAYYNFVAMEGSLLGASPWGKEEASLQAKISSFSGGVGA